jgi:RNA polymerase sigma factor (sigma-70 family)
MSKAPPTLSVDRRAELSALAIALRPDLHRFCARLMGSVIEGEDVVQDTLVRALEALPGLDKATPLRPWLFRIAHNRALDRMRSRLVRQTEPMEAAARVADLSNPDPLEALMRRDAVKTAVSRFAELPIHQRSAVSRSSHLSGATVRMPGHCSLEGGGDCSQCQQWRVERSCGFQGGGAVAVSRCVHSEIPQANSF